MVNGVLLFINAIIICDNGGGEYFTEDVDPETLFTTAMTLSPMRL